LSDETFKELEDVHAKAAKFVDMHFPAVKKYPRDYRLTVITIMRYLIDIERLRLERAIGWIRMKKE
jgi:hypothetical protein